MRIGIFSDVHGNLEALETVLQYLVQEKIEQYLCIGDMIGYGPNPNECVELIKNLGCVSVGGNHDYGVSEKTDIDNFNDAAKTAIAWTKQKISKRNLAYLTSLSLRDVDNDILLVHARPDKPETWKYVFTLAQAQEQFAHFQEKICLIGHSHIPIIIEKNEETDKCTVINKSKVKIKGSGYRYLINVGSVGQPRDNSPASCFVIYDTKTSYLEIKRLEYNFKLTQEKILKAGLPETLASRLAVGK
ncbi:MAG: metallophosphoesterase family protein [Candidatus Latescibacteria bacterium]|nr:metallophosphoesterase family protein [Candidatus Latescibacterota bacterium]